jgi:MFS family permease
MLQHIPGREGRGVTGKQFFSSLKGLLKNPTILGLVISGSIRGMGSVSVFAFFTLYLREDLGFSPAKAGVFFTIMMASGILSQPLLGYMSDRFGRKIVMVPSLVMMGIFEIILVWAGAGVGLALVAACIGLFIYAIGAVIQAAAMDVAPEEAGATTIALMFGTQALFTIPAPTIAGWLSETYGTPSVFLFSGGLVLLSSVIVMFLPIDRKMPAEAINGVKAN